MRRVVLLVDPNASSSLDGFYLVPEERFKEVFKKVSENTYTNTEERSSMREMHYHMFNEVRSPWKYGEWDDVQIIAAYKYIADSWVGG